MFLKEGEWLFCPCLAPAVTEAAGFWGYKCVMFLSVSQLGLDGSAREQQPAQPEALA